LPWKYQDRKYASRMMAGLLATKEVRALVARPVLFEQVFW
jgi:hypothetical protein